MRVRALTSDHSSQILREGLQTRADHRVQSDGYIEFARASRYDGGFFSVQVRRERGLSVSRARVCVHVQNEQLIAARACANFGPRNY